MKPIYKFFAVLLWKCSTAILLIGVGVLLGIGLAAPMIGWKLSEDASGVLTSLIGGITSVATVVVLFEWQQARTVGALMVRLAIPISNFKDAVNAAIEDIQPNALAQHTEAFFLSQKEPGKRARYEAKVVATTIEGAVLMDLNSFLEAWKNAGVHQNLISFEIFQRLHSIADLALSLRGYISKVRMEIDSLAGAGFDIETNAIMERTYLKALHRDLDLLFGIPEFSKILSHRGARWSLR